MALRTAGAVVLVVVLAIFGGLTAHAGTWPFSNAERAPDAPIVDCETRSQVIGGAPDPSNQDITAGPVSFYAARSLAREPRSEFEPRGPAELAAVKLAFVIDARTQATLSLGARSRRHAVISVGRDQRPPVRGAEVSLSACSQDATVGGRRVGRRTVFLGGFRLDGPRCLTINVTASSLNETRTRNLAIGRRTCGSSSARASECPAAALSLPRNALGGAGRAALRHEPARGRPSVVGAVIGSDRAGYVSSHCGGRALRRTVIVTIDRRAYHPSASASLGIYAVSRFADGYRVWSQLH